MFAGTNIPTGWLYCGGQELNATENPIYISLYDVIGTNYGGSGQSNFYLPNLSQKMPIGSTSQNQRFINYQGNNTVVSSGNSTLSSNQLPSYTHDMTHIHNFNISNNNAIPNPKNALKSGTNDRVVSIGDPYQDGLYPLQNSDNAAGSNSANSGGSTEILPPFCALNFIIFYGL
jgi:hypothetical protein